MLPDGSFDGIRSLTTSHSADRAQRIDLPPRLLVVNYLGLPLSGQVSERAQTGYRLLREFGSVKRLRALSEEDLIALPWLPKTVGRAVYERLSTTA